MDNPRVLLVDDDDDLRHALTQGLEIDGFEVLAFANGQDLVELISTRFYGVIVSDMRMQGMDGNDLLKRVMEIDASLPLILITGHGDVSMAVSSMRLGAYDFIEKPFATSHLSAVISRAIEKRRLVLENRTLRENLDAESPLDKTFVGRHQSIVGVRAQIEMLGATDIDIMIVGETGTGKDVVARALHDAGQRKIAAGKPGPFVALNCGALPKEIIESELFGHEAGAFTGAQKRRIGKIEHASGGTLFLDEIESMPVDLQVKLLRVVETRSIERLGSNISIKLDVRFIAASKIDLQQASARGDFRQDLYFRLNVASIFLPPLRQRPEDILILFYHLTRRARARFRREIPQVTPAFEAQLLSHDWPGNVRELRNIADRFVLGLGLGIGQSLGAGQNLGAGQGANGTSAATAGAPLARQLAHFERALIAGEIARNNGALKPTYENLGISRKALYEKMKKLGLRPQHHQTQDKN